MKFSSARLLLLAAVAICYSATSLAASGAPIQPLDNTTIAQPISTDDHHTCLEQGLTPGDTATKENEAYFRCRASLLRQKAKNTNPIMANLNPMTIKENKSLEEAAKAFDTQAEEAANAYRRERDTQRAGWQASEEAKVEQYKQQDHAACLDKGYFIGKWEDPRTEAYFTCRQTLAEARITPPDQPSGYRPTQLPDAVKSFKNEAEKAKEAFNARDYQDHYRCLDQGLFPGPMEEPVTSKYYACRADLARNGLGQIVAEIFTEDATKARKIAEQHTSCELKGLMKGSASYDVCRETLARYDACVTSSRSNKKSKDGQPAPRECEQIISLLRQ